MTDETRGDTSVIDELDERYIETLQEQARLRGEAYERLTEAEAFPQLALDHIAGVVAEHADDFETSLVVLVASDFGQPQAFVPDGVDADALLAALLDELHRERGKWNGDDERLRAVRADLFDRCAHLHKGLAALVAEDGTVTYDLGAGHAETSNFVTIRQVAGLVDWLTNSYQAETLRTTY